MVLNKKISIRELRESFSTEYPDNMASVTESRLDIDYEAKAINQLFSGVKWERVDDDMLSENYDIAFHLSPQAFYYYLPAFICATQRDIVKHKLLAFTLVDMLADCEHIWPKQLKDREAELLSKDPILKGALELKNIDGRHSWRQKRWGLLTVNQWDLVLTWLKWLLPYEDANSDVLTAAIHNAEELRSRCDR